VQDDKVDGEEVDRIQHHQKVEDSKEHYLVADHHKQVVEVVDELVLVQVQ
jgi:hypothetical protein